MQTIILLPGWTRNAKTYKKLLHTAPLNTHVEVFNYADVLRQDTGSDIAAALQALIAKKNIDKFSLAGHSLGGAFAIDFAARFPQHIEHLYLIDSEGVYMQASIPAQFYTMMHDHILNGHRKIFLNIHSLGRILQHPIRAYQLARIAYQADYVSAAQQISVPTTILWGEKDLVTTVSQGKVLAKNIKGSTFTVFTALDHDWVLYQPQKFWVVFQNK